MPRGVRLNPAHDERTRAKIQTSQIINRLESLVMGKIEMSPPAVSAALGLLRKTLPDLNATEISGTVQFEDVTDNQLDTLISGLAAEIGISAGAAGKKAATRH